MTRIWTTACLALTAVMLPLTAVAGRGEDSAHIDAAEHSAHRPEVLRLGCHARVIGDTAGARCTWSAPTADGASGVRLLRVAIGSDTGRTVVFRTDDLQTTEYVDTPIRIGVRYAYAVQALSSSGRVVSQSRAVIVGVPVPKPPTVEPLRLSCRAASSDEIERHHVGCEWSQPVSPARLLTLWRSLDGAARERVASFAVPFASSYRDVVPAGTTSAVYAVIATDGDGEIVARSRAVAVEFVDRPTTRSDSSIAIEPSPVSAPPSSTPVSVVPPATTTPQTAVTTDRPTSPTTTAVVARDRAVAVAVASTDLRPTRLPTPHTDSQTDMVPADTKRGVAD